jgi:murein DD-endopeptidase MepM/ murein hydrolase activator NlpD
MKQPYFVVVLAHSLHGRLRRVHIPQQALYAVLMLAVLGCFTLVIVVSSYARMAWKMASYNSLRKEAASVRAQYNSLNKEFIETKGQLAALQLFATEVSNAYGIKRRLEGPSDISGEGSLVPTDSESLEQYNFLKSANVSRFHRSYPRLWQVKVSPDLWPVDGRLIGSFGKRSDPFSGEQAFHYGVDLSAPIGSPIRAAADGTVVEASYSGGGFGRLVVIDHGGGVRTYYAHLSRIDVIAGQEVRRGEIVGALGRSGRTTAPHLHYEVRIGGNPVNPYMFLARSNVARSAGKDLPF